MKIKVTAEDIKRGKPKVTTYCPIALAIRRAFPGRIVSVGPQSVTVHGPDNALELYRDLPPEAQAFIFNFDRGQSVEPFEFEIDVVAPQRAPSPEPGPEPVP